MEETCKTVPSIVVYVTVPNREAGIESVYEWEGKVQSDSEELLIIKTRQSLLESLTEHINANHEYNVPEVVALPITGGSDKYRMVEKQYEELRSQRLVAFQRQWLLSIGFFYISTTSVVKVKRVKCNTGPVQVPYD